MRALRPATDWLSNTQLVRAVGWLHRARAHFGRRGVVLMDLGAMWLIVAAGLVVAATPPRGVPHEQWPIPVRVTVWAVPGLCAIGVAFYKRFDAWGWGLLVVPVVERAASFGYAWVDSFTPAWWVLFRGEGYSAGWLAVLLYGTVGLLIKKCGDGLDRPFSPIDGERGGWPGTGA